MKPLKKGHSSNTNIRKTLLNTVEMIGESILNVNDDDLIEILLFGNCKFSLKKIRL